MLRASSQPAWSGIARTGMPSIVRRVAEQLFHLGVAAQVEAALHHRDAEHRAVEDGLVLEQRIAQRFLGPFLLGAVLDDPDRALGRVARIDDVADQLRPHDAAVLARHVDFGCRACRPRAPAARRPIQS
jgi:hypothetical protein